MSFFFPAESYSTEGYSSQVGVKDAAPVIISLPSFHMVDVLPYNIIYLVCFTASQYHLSRIIQYTLKKCVS